MKSETLLSLSVILFCLFIARGVFAGTVNEAAVADRGVAVKAGNTAQTGFALEGSQAPGKLPELRVTHAKALVAHHLIGPSYATLKILSLMEKRVADRELLKKIKDKLPSLGEDRLNMLASLSEEIDSPNHGARTDFAFLVLTTLIIFS